MRIACGPRASSSSSSSRARRARFPAAWVASIASLFVTGRAVAGEPVQDSPSSRRAPRELVAVANGNRDWGPAVLAGKLVVAGGPRASF